MDPIIENDLSQKKHAVDAREHLPISDKIE